MKDKHGTMLGARMFAPLKSVTESFQAVSSAEKNVYTVSEVAKLLKVSYYTVYREIRKGHLGHFRVGRAIRITEKQLNSFKEG